MPNQIDDGYEKWEYSPEGLHYRFGGVYGFTTQEQELLFFTALSKLPKRVINFADEKIFFTSLDSSVFAETFRLSRGFLKGRSALVIFYPTFWKQKTPKIVETIAHEIAHVYLKHETGCSHNLEKEKEADEQASKWLGYKVKNYLRLEKKIKRLEKDSQFLK